MDNVKALASYVKRIENRTRTWKLNETEKNETKICRRKFIKRDGEISYL